jgi:hypothetical protein
MHALSCSSSLSLALLSEVRFYTRFHIEAQEEFILEVMLKLATHLFDPPARARLCLVEAFSVVFEADITFSLPCTAQCLDFSPSSSSRVL